MRYCPTCRVEYREGFTRCSDCNAELVGELRSATPQETEIDVNSRPDLAPRRFFLAWFLPCCVLITLIIGLNLRPLLFQNIFFPVVLMALCFLSSFGSYWMIYQAIRYERHVWRYVLLSFVPFMFVWYSLVRVPLRKEFEGKSEFIR